MYVFAIVLSNSMKDKLLATSHKKKTAASLFYCHQCGGGGGGSCGDVPPGPTAL
jgi:hypothetical protein